MINIGTLKAIISKVKKQPPCFDLFTDLKQWRSPTNNTQMQLFLVLMD